MRVIPALPLFIPIDLPEQLLKVLDEPLNLGLLLLTGRQSMWEVVAQHHAYAQAEYEATEEHLAIHTLSSHRLPAEAVVTRAWTWPDDTGHIWEALSPHFSCIRKQLKIKASIEETS